MKAEIHPEYVVARVHCTCGNEFTTHATREEYHLEICSQCHPFYTGRQKLVDTGGRVERFQRRVAKGRLGAQRASARRERSETEAAPSAPADSNGAAEAAAAEPESNGALTEAPSGEAQGASGETHPEQPEAQGEQTEQPEAQAEQPEGQPEQEQAESPQPPGDAEPSA